MERTGEFFTVVDVLKRHAGVAPSALAQLAAVKPQGASQLHRFSRSVARDVRACQKRVGKLMQLAQRKGLFDDPAAEINELARGVKADLKAIDGQLQTLAAEATRQQSANGRGGAAQPAHWPAVVDILRGHALEMTRHFQDALRIRSENMKDQAARRRQFATSRWAPSAAALPLDSPLFGAPMGGQQQPQSQLPAVAGAPSASAATTQPHSSSMPPSPHASAAQHGTQFVAGNGPAAAADAGIAGGLRRRPGQVQGGDSGHHGFAQPPLASGPGRPAHAYGGQPGPPQATNGFSAGKPQFSAYPQQQPSSNRFALPGSGGALHGSGGGGGGLGLGSYTAQQLAGLHDARQRENDMKSVESTIVELGAMFTQMAGLVAEQGDTIERIDADMDVVTDNVNAAHNELGKYFDSVSRNRGFILRLFAVVAFIILLFGVFRPGQPSSSYTFEPVPLADASSTSSGGGGVAPQQHAQQQPLPPGPMGEAAARKIQRHS